MGSYLPLRNSRSGYEETEVDNFSFFSIMEWNTKYYSVLIVNFIKRLEQIYTNREFKPLFRCELQTL